MSGMLSNTAETKPRPKAVCQEATGNFSTGIIERTSPARAGRCCPWRHPGSSSTRAGARHRERDRHPDGRAEEGKISEISGNFVLTVTLVHDGGDQDPGHDAHARPVNTASRRWHPSRSAICVLLQRGRECRTHSRAGRRPHRHRNVERIDAGNPHHGGGGVAHHAARAAGVGGGDDRREVADVHAWRGRR